jgi:hypothetical protein
MTTPLTLQEGVIQQREALRVMLRGPLQHAAELCSFVWHDRSALDAALAEAFRTIPGCKYLYALGTDAIQVSSNISRDGLMPQMFGRDRSQRPYMNEKVPADGFVLSQIYLSLNQRRPSLTAIQLVRGSDWRVLGFVGADFDLRDLPITRKLYEEPKQWRQVKGDPAIRGGVFLQSRVDSQMDSKIDLVLDVVQALMTEHGVFHIMLHFSSNRAVAWVIDDPYRYRLLDIEALTDANTCLALPRHDYPADAQVRREQIRPVLDNLRALRFMDETLYLRSGTLNIFNGVVGLTFSCDGSHYVPVDEFLDKGCDFWVKGGALGG